MASTKEFLDYVIDRLSLDDMRYRKMMGEYILYYHNKVVGGIYDNRLLLKITKSVPTLMEEKHQPLNTDIPYPGAKTMLAVEVEQTDLIRGLMDVIAKDLS